MCVFLLYMCVCVCACVCMCVCIYLAYVCIRICCNCACICCPYCSPIVMLHLRNSQVPSQTCTIRVCYHYVPSLYAITVCYCCPHITQDILTKCWCYDPDTRIPFAKMLEDLKKRMPVTRIASHPAKLSKSMDSIF